MSATRLRVEVDRFRLHAPFVISNFTWHHAEVCTVHLERDGCVGRGEGVPIAYRPEGARDIARQVEGLRAELEGGLDRKALDERLPAGPARCAVDAALWELEAGLGLGPVHERAGLPAPRTIETAITVVFGSPDEMARQASRFADCPLLKVKLGGSRDAEAIRA
ncbi:MAG: dipeptide epimerase, partial [Myxococcota bacterium]